MKTLLLSIGLLASCAAHAALDGPLKEGGKSYALRQGPSELARYTSQAECETAARDRTSNPGAIRQTFQIRSGSGAVLGTETSQEACIAAVRARLIADAATRTTGGNVNSCVVSTNYSTAFQPPTCVSTFNYIARYTGTAPDPEPEPEPECPVCPPPTPVTCPAPPASRNLSRGCPEGTTGDTWTQTVSVTVGPAPSCSLAIVLSPATSPLNECTPATRAASLSWTSPTTNTNGTSLTNLAGYRISYGRSQNELISTVQVANPGATRYVLTLPESGVWFFAVRAYTSNGTESALSNIVTKTVQ
jgi:hypothetical protein